ncbi:MAG TPA: Ig-like domain-containing protein, partial [Pirellulaceae bacterium]|nr:Ig-like domain-containing protein [Pirellulaceae bacterium]
MELRRVLAADWRNPVDSLDVDTDGFVVPIDALKIINDLNSTGARELPEQYDGTSPYFDVDGDRFIAPVDVLAIINHLNSGLNVSGKRVLTERGLLTTESDVTITLGQESRPQIYRVQIDSSVDSTDTQPIVEDVLAVYLVDPVEQDRTLVDRGQPGSTLFTLAGRNFEVASGVAAWDGSVLELDLTGVQSRGTALLRFQLIGADSDRGTRFTISPLTNRIQEERVERLAFPNQRSVVPGGLSVDLATLTTPSGVSATVENIKFNSITRRYTADMRLRNDGTPLGRDVVAIFPGLVNVAMMNASGVTSQFDPYVNFRNAIPSGGLDRGMTSDAVEITLFSPSLAPFSLRPTFRAGANHPPVLDALGPLTVMPGSSLTVALHGTDQDGDALTYSLTADRSLPAGKLAADGKLTIRPKPSQVGSYTLDVVVSDGVLETHRAVALNVVADPDTTTRVSGVVQQVNGQPIAGVPIEIGGVQGLTGANGSFTLNLGAGPIVTDTIKIRGDLVTGGLTFPYIAEKLPLLLEHDIYAQVNNVITRPIYLPALDVANSKQINPAVDTTVTTAAIPGASVFVAAGTLMNQQGTPFTGRLSITEVPITLTPAALPNGLHPDLVVTIQPGDMVFARPAPISLPNRAGYPAGTVMDLWSINPVTGTFEVVGMGKVRDDGTMIDTISGGVRNSSWHDFAVVNLEPKDTEDERNEDPGCDECGAERPLTSSVELHSGAVIETHTLTTYQSQGAERGLTLTYDSLRADPRPIVHVGIDATKDFPANCVQNGTPCLIAGRPIPAPDDKSLLVASL